MNLQEKDFKVLRNLFDVEVIDKGVGDNLPVLGGYVSTSSPDLVGDIIPPSAFNKWFDNYKRNPIYCFDHNRSMPIGRVNNPRITDKGLYLEDIVLSAIPIVKDYLSILIRDKVLSQQSVGFYALGGHYDKATGYYIHDEVFLYEGSLVSVACNPTATLDSIKSLIGNKFNLYEDEKAFFEAYDRGEVTKKFSIGIMDNPLYKNMPSILRDELNLKSPNFTVLKQDTRFSHSLNKWINQHFAEPELPSVEYKEINMTNIIDLSNMKAISLTPEQRELLDVEGTVVAKPNVKAADYGDVAPLLFASRIDANNKTVFTTQIADKTEKGFVYNWNMVVEAVAKTLGAKGVLLMPTETKRGIIARLSEAYSALGKKFPTYKDADIDLVSDEDFEEMTFGNVDFHEDEKTLFTQLLIMGNIKQTAEAIKSLEELPEDLKETIKSVFSYICVDVCVSPDGPDDTKLVADILALIDAYNQAEMEDEASDSESESTSPLMLMNEVIDEAIKALESRKITVEKTVEEAVEVKTTKTFDDSVLEEALRNFLK